MNRDTRAIIEDNNVKALLEYDILPMFMLAVERKSIDIIEYFVSKDIPTMNAIHDAKIITAKKGNLSIMRILHTKYHKIHNDTVSEKNILWLAVRGSHIKLTAWLLEYGYRNNDLATAVNSPNIDMVKLLKKYNVKLDVRVLLGRIKASICRKRGTQLKLKLDSCSKEEVAIMHYIHDNFGYNCDLHKRCGLCKINKKDKTLNHWQMETEEYNSTIQWLPKEMVEDTLNLI